MKLPADRSEEHTSELQSLRHLVCRLLLEKKKKPSFSSLAISADRPQSGRVHAFSRVPYAWRFRSWRSRRKAVPQDRASPASFFFNEPAPPEFSPLSLQRPFRR